MEKNLEKLLLHLDFHQKISFGCEVISVNIAEADLKNRVYAGEVEILDHVENF